MAERTAIQWTDHTFNIAWGCTKVSPGCANCYADAQAHRYGFDVWGPGTERRTFGEKHWNEPRKWNRDAEKEGRRHRVFCSSMCDVFEDHPTIDAERLKLWELIDQTPWLDWQILTKRADRLHLMPIRMRENVWLGVSVEDQARADERIPFLLKATAAVRFLSVEPLLGPVDLGDSLYTHGCKGGCHGGTSMNPVGGYPCGTNVSVPREGIDWVIVGGESGPGARPMDVGWALKILTDCRLASVACFMKQLGGNVVARQIEDLGPEAYRAWDSEHANEPFPLEGVRPRLSDRKGGDMAEWPEDLRVRQFPTASA